MTDENPGALVRVDEGLLSEEQHKNLARMANTLGVSGLFPDATDQAKVYAKVLLGRSIGLSPMESMTGIHIVEGKPQLAATMLASFIRQSKRYEYEVDDHDATKCSISFFDTSGEGDDALIGTSTFTIEEAEQAELIKPKSAWKKYPRNMLFARALSNGVRWYAPDLFGGVAVYTEADEFERRPSIGAGEGDGAPRGIPLTPEVEAVIARAQSLGHAALSDRATVEMAVDGLTVEKVSEWVSEAEETLDSIDVVDADVLPAADDATGWRERSATFLAAWEALSPEEQETEQGKALKHEADESLHKAMNIEEDGGVSATVVKHEDVEGGEEA